jgi:hypothetical protein
VILAAPCAAQARRELASDHPQANLMGYYAAAMSFSPVGLPRPGLSLGATIGMIPTLSLEDRSVGFGGTKAEDTNRCRFVPRLSASWATAGGLAVEAGLTPSATVCGVTASTVAGAVSYRVELAPSWEGLGRISYSRGKVEGDFTCSAAEVADQLNQTCYQGSPSTDKVTPSAYGFGVAFAYRGWRRRNLSPYVMIGFNRERVDFDVNYTRPFPNSANLPAIDDHQRLRATLTRVHAAAGTGWSPARWLTLAGEVFYEPGALLTVRGAARVRVLGGGR